MSTNDSECNKIANNNKWLHPNEVLKLHRLKLKQKQLQARINKTTTNSLRADNALENIIPGTLKRRNPFLKFEDSKRLKSNDDIDCEESSDRTLYKLLDITNSNCNFTSKHVSFNEIFKNIETTEATEPVAEEGKTWIPIDWSLKTKVRLMSTKPFVWSQKLKISEEASGITGFVRCLDVDSKSSLDTSPNARFHQCCLYWQQPYLPWLNLFPRNNCATSVDSVCSSAMRESLQTAWTDSLRSLFQLLRTCQCPYFYVCTNTFTVLFRAAGICGNSEISALVTPTTRGFRQMLKKEDIEFSMPLKDPEQTDSSETHEDEEIDEQWLESLGIQAEDIKQINYTQSRIIHKSECDVDNSEKSSVLIEGMEVQAFYNFLLNCKSCISLTGPLAGIPPTLLASVAFTGATLCSLKVKESKTHLAGVAYSSLELNGPILPHVIHNLCSLHLPDYNLTATLTNFSPTSSFSKIRRSQKQEKNDNTSRTSIFGQENLSDCGLDKKLLKQFCSSDIDRIHYIDSLKYNPETKTYTCL